MIWNQSKKCALLLALVLALPFLWNQSVAIASAATPAFAKSSVAIEGDGKTYQLEIKNKVAGSTYKWSSTKTSVAKISAKGVVTATGSGTTTIYCKMTYPNKKVKTISCKVTVTIPSEDIKINNATQVNGAHILQLGEKFDFNVDITPSKSSDKAYWYIDGGDKDCITIDNNETGVVTAKKVGKVILVSSAVKNLTQAEADKSIINDAIIIEVVGPSRRVGSAEIVDSTELKVVFETPINQNTVIGNNNALLDSIEIVTRKNVKGVMAAELGALTASLSADMRTLSIYSTNAFDGEYGISFTGGIKTVDGAAIESYYKRLSFTDTTPPAIENFYPDETGMITTIRFTEAIDFTSFKVSGAQIFGSQQSVDPNTLNIINNKMNYIVSEDKKSVTINLFGINPNDYGKTFSAIFTGIKDLKGNVPVNNIMTIYLRVDNTLKPQAIPISVLRTGYNTITATFDRAISAPGGAIIEGSYSNGIVDTKNNKKVNYTLSDVAASYSGYKKVQIGYWDSYNVSKTDLSAQKMHDFNVDFTADKSSPVLLNYEFDPKNSILTLTYNEDVSLIQPTGIFTARLEMFNGNITPGLNISYTRMATEDNRTVKLALSNMSLIGNYKFTLIQGFVMDSYRNISLAREIVISNATESDLELPAPYRISQDPTNLSKIHLDFADKLDLDSARDISNYNIPGVSILSVELYKNDTESGATVILTVAEGSIAITTEWPITINGVKGYNGSYTALNDTIRVELKENLRPIHVSTTYDRAVRNLIKLNFSEKIQGTMKVKVTQQYGSIPVEYTSNVAIIDNNVLITLNTEPVNGTLLRIDVISNGITDMNGNASTIMPTFSVLASY